MSVGAATLLPHRKWTPCARNVRMSCTGTPTVRMSSYQATVFIAAGMAHLHPTSNRCSLIINHPPDLTFKAAASLQGYRCFA